MKINFYPESDSPILEKAAKEYSALWKDEGEKIQAEIEKVSGLKFKKKIVNAVTVIDDVSYSVPLKLEADTTFQQKRGTLIHELCHRLFVENDDLKIDFDYSDKDWNLKLHKIIDLILFDICANLYGEKFANDLIKTEASLWGEEGISPYKIAWEWALSMTKEQRQKEFEKLLS